MKLFLLTFILIIGVNAMEQDEKMTISEQNQTFVTYEELNKIVFDIVQDLDATKVELKEKDATLQKLHKEVSFLKDPPMTFTCATHSLYQDSLTGKTIPYTKLLYSSSNVESVLDITTGVFTAGYPGSYTATWSLWVPLGYQGTTSLRLYLRKNGENIEESTHFTYHDGPSPAYDQGGRTLVLHLDKGDTLELYCAWSDGYIADVSFCVSLSQYDAL